MYNFDRYDVLNPPALSGLFNSFGITTCFLATALFRNILGRNPELLKPLKVLFTGGEPGRYEDFVKAKAENPDLTIHHIYGPTECCVFTTIHYFKLSSEFPTSGNVSIGRPLSTLQIVILDAHGRLVPPGVGGEMHIRGQCLADGYQDREHETKAVFLEKQIFGINEVPCIFYRTVSFLSVMYFCYYPCIIVLL